MYEYCDERSVYIHNLALQNIIQFEGQSPININFGGIDDFLIYVNLLGTNCVIFKN